MRKTILASILIPLFIGSKAQRNESSESRSIPSPPGVMLKNGRAAGYNDDNYISALATEYKSEKKVDTSLYKVEILKDLNSWWTYTYQNINLYQDFIGIAPNSKPLSKRTFLQLLTTGEFYPIKTDIKNNVPYYTLCPLYSDNKEIQNTIIQLASDELFYYNMEGKELPTYKFEDLAGYKYDNVILKERSLF